jgi:hypothetical protein
MSSSTTKRLALASSRDYPEELHRRNTFTKLHSYPHVLYDGA